MTVLLDRWQFGVTITYHFLFVPLTIGLAFLVAIMQVLAYRRKDAVWERLTRFFGTLFLINFAMGIVTGIVQEFQFGMNWSNYSVFVGNIFGAPLAMEGLLAFFAESTFIGLWIFGRNRLPPLVHTLSICVVSLGTHRVRVLHPHRQRLDAAPRRLPHRGKQGGAHRLLGSAAELHAVGRVLPYRAGRLRDRRDGRARRLGMAAAPGRKRCGLHPFGQIVGLGGPGLHRPGHGHR